jgi:hypothetical protein
LRAKRRFFKIIIVFLNLFKTYLENSEIFKVLGKSGNFKNEMLRKLDLNFTENANLQIIKLKRLKLYEFFDISEYIKNKSNNGRWDYKKM